MKASIRWGTAATSTVNAQSLCTVPRVPNSSRRLGTFPESILSTCKIWSFSDLWSSYPNSKRWTMARLRNSTARSRRRQRPRASPSGFVPLLSPDSTNSQDSRWRMLGSVLADNPMLAPPLANNPISHHRSLTTSSSHHRLSTTLALRCHHLCRAYKNP